MTKLQELALNEIEKIAEEVDDGLSVISSKVINKQDVDRKENVWPLSEKVREIKHWVEAIQEEE